MIDPSAQRSFPFGRRPLGYASVEIKILFELKFIPLKQYNQKRENFYENTSYLRHFPTASNIHEENA